jgi:hypothetical protein
MGYDDKKGEQNENHANFSKREKQLNHWVIKHYSEST